MRAGFLFAGIGGDALGLERAGFSIAWLCESDAYCRRVLAKHWPDVPCYLDATDIHGAERVDLLAGGFPCQPVSVAGKRLAQADERWLWPLFAAAIRDIRPHYVLVENVPGLLARAMGDVLGDLATLGFDAEWTVFGARDVGAPHIRERVWLVAHANSGPVESRRRGWRAGEAGELADSDSQGELQQGGSFGPQRGWSSNGCQSLAHTSGERSQARVGAITDVRGWADAPSDGWWAAEPNVGRVAHGVPARVDRLRALGNAVVPACAEWIGRRILEHAEQLT